MTDRKELLNDVVKYNQKELDKVNGDQNKAEKLYTIKYKGFSIWNPFFNVNMTKKVNPYVYYDKEELNKMLKEYKNKKS